MTGIIMDRSRDIPLSKDLFQFLVRSPELHIMIKDEAGDNEETNQNNQYTKYPAEPAEFPGRFN